jgi:PAS domain S-box-containing protein
MQARAISAGGLFGLAVFVVILTATTLAQEPDESLLFIRMPSAARAVAEAGPDEIGQFVSRRRAFLAMAESELLRDSVLAREVLGETRIFEELEEFYRTHGTRARIRFVDWDDAFRYLSDYVADPLNPPAVAQLGDTWAGHFRSQRVIAFEKGNFWGVRALWYWKHLIDPKTVKTAQGFLAISRELRTNPPPGLIAPFVIPTAPSWDLLHNLAVWLYNSGSPPLVSVDRKFGLLPWREAILADQAGTAAARFLMLLAREGLVALPEMDSPLVVEDFLDGKYAMVVVSPWIAGRAHKKLGAGWESRIAPTLPPSLEEDLQKTSIMGSLLVVLDPSRGLRPESVGKATSLVEFLTSGASQIRCLDDSGDLPYSPEALSRLPYADFYAAAREGAVAYPQIPEWGPVIENLVTRDNLYAFWKRLAVLNKSEGQVSEAEQQHREKMILAALQSAEDEINRNLSPGKWLELWPWLVAALFLLSLATCASILSYWAERRKHQAKIAESEARYKDLYDHAPDMFCSLGFPIGSILECNETFLDKTGYTRKEVLGRDMFTFYQPDSREKAAKALVPFREKGRVEELELELRTKCGRKLQVSLSASAVRDTSGDIIRVRAVLRDITRRKELEELSEQRRQELAHVARLATVGEFTASLAHELNQPLTAVVTNAQAARRIAAKESPNLGEVRTILADIATEGQRAAQVIRALRNLLIKNECQSSHTDMNEVVKEVIYLLRRQPPLKDVAVRLKLDPGLPKVLGDRTQLEQVILNLVLNASEAMQCLPPKARSLVVQTLSREGGEIEVAVQDSGAGIEDSAKERIFEPFFTTKPNGLGMGLPISRTIIEGHGGTLWATPGPEGGTTFHFTVKACVSF